jgi:uncharacterized protein (DUF488 family)
VTNKLFTVGHSTHPLEVFLRLLTMNNISAIADVRSCPYSRMNPQFNQEPLKTQLKMAGIVYAPLGRELGARTDERSCYENGKVQYDRLARTPLFREGLKRLLEGVQTHRVALLCAEKDPITCHRMVLVCHELRHELLDIFHILADGSLEANAEAERRMVEAVSLPEHDLFTSRDETIEEAYRLQGNRIAWVETEPDNSVDVSAQIDAEATR